MSRSSSSDYALSMERARIALKSLTGRDRFSSAGYEAAEFPIHPEILEVAIIVADGVDDSGIEPHGLERIVRAVLCAERLVREGTGVDKRTR